MENNNNNNNEQFDNEDFTDSDDLLYSLTYGIRKFIFSSGWEDALIGVILEENKDSFLVAMPVKHIMVEGETFAKAIPTGQDPFIRLLKASVRAVSSVEQQPERLYVEYLIQKAPEQFPELLEMIGMDENYVHGEEVPEEEIKNIVEEIKQARTDNSLKDAVLINAVGVTNKEIDDKVKKAVSEGSFVPISGKLAN